MLFQSKTSLFGTFGLHQNNDYLTGMLLNFIMSNYSGYKTGWDLTSYALSQLYLGAKSCLLNLKGLQGKVKCSNFLLGILSCKLSFSFMWYFAVTRSLGFFSDIFRSVCQSRENNSCHTSSGSEQWA